jgi:hypothetical protein
VTVTGYKPTKGPAAGGTKVTVYGNHLDSGSEVEVTLAGVDCMIKERYVPFSVYYMDLCD